MEVNNAKLEEEFNMREIRENISDIVKDIKSCNDEELLNENLEKAQRLLNLLMDQVEGNAVEEEIDEDNPRPRRSNAAELYKAGAQLVNVITSTITTKSGLFYDEANLSLRQKQLEIREKEIELKHEIKKLSTNNPQLPAPTNNNIIVIQDRESLLKAIAEAEEDGDIIDVNHEEIESPKFLEND